MRCITMTDEQTEQYESADERVSIALMHDLIRQAQALADQTRQTVEIYTATGIVADARSPGERT